MQALCFLTLEIAIECLFLGGFGCCAVAMDLALLGCLVVALSAVALCECKLQLTLLSYKGLVVMTSAVVSCCRRLCCLSVIGNRFRWLRGS